MYLDLFYSFIIGLVGAILFLLVDKYEPEGPFLNPLTAPDTLRLCGKLIAPPRRISLRGLHLPIVLRHRSASL
jgi:hypothetical protein